MNTPFCRSFLTACALTIALLLLVPCAEAIDSKAVKKLFRDPPREYATAPLWVWNDLLTEQQIRDTLRDLAGQKVRQVFVHPRPGLMTPYLSADWFRLWKVALDEAQKLDLNVWIYDENSYPSGFAGGFVPELMPESRGMGLHFKESKGAPPWEANTVAVFRLDGQRVDDVSAKVRAGEAAKGLSGEAAQEVRYLVAEIRRAGNSPWHGNRSYVNLLTAGVTEKFLEVTLEAYQRELGPQFGKRIPGSFTDEPEIRPAGGLPWCPDLPEQFRKRWGYSLLENLASLTREVGDWRKVRHHYYSTLNDLFIERWAKPYYQWCEKNGLAFTGHYWDHEWPNCVGVPDNMSMAAWQQIPGIDCLMNQYAEHTHAQFGNVRFVRELSSIANQLGRRRTLCEIYGAGGWDLRFEDMKRIADWLAVLGVNLFDEHLSYVTLRGARKRDHPQSFSYHEPWWDSYHVMAEYLTRLSYALSQGEQLNRVLVIEPTTTAWMYQGNGTKLRELGDSFFNLLLALEAAQIEYDLGCEEVLARRGSIDGTQLRVGHRAYDVVVLPAHTENINRSTVRLGEQWLQAGGKILCLGDPPARVDGVASSEPAEGAGESGWKSARPEQAVTLLTASSRDAFRLVRAAGDKGILFHQRRNLDDGQVLLLVNTSIEAPATGTIQSEMRAAEQWDLFTGEVKSYPFETSPTGIKASFQLPPSGSLLLFLAKTALNNSEGRAARAPGLAGTGRRIAPPADAPLQIRRLGPNVLTLDYVEVTAGGETRSNQYFYAANQFAWQKNGMDRNPWDSAVQFKDELISKKFPAESGFTARYRFTIEGAVPKNLALVIERPDLYTITCNGHPLTAGAPPASGSSEAASRRTSASGAAADWWLDKAFGKMPIAVSAQSGENVVTLTAKPFTMFHELEAAYLLGDFAVKPVQRGFVIVPDAPLTLAPATGRLAHHNNPDGSMWLSGGVGFAGGRDDRAPFIVFDLGQPIDLRAIRIWNYNENHVRNLTARGVDKLRIRIGETADKIDRDLGTFLLARASGAEAMPEDLRVSDRTRFVRFDILSSHHGVQYPASNEAVDNGFVGLAEVQFVDAAGQTARGVKIHQVSSELAAHRRVARYLVDSSGLVGARPGWNEQGHPFYAEGVAYRQRFDLEQPTGAYRVALPDWYGSVAKVMVNGQLAGHIVSPPWECDVTKELKRGANEVEVTVIGTLKNTLGPHHGGHALGSAWPGMFQNGPKNGPPPGRQYATVGYGLFAPFELRQWADQ